MDDSIATDFKPLACPNSTILPVSSVELLESVNPSVDTGHNNNAAARNSRKKTVSRDDSILIIDDYQNTSSTCIDLTELDDTPSNDDIIVGRTYIRNLIRAPKTSTASTSRLSSLLSDGSSLSRRRRKRGIANVNGAHDATIIIDDDRIDSSVVKVPTAKKVLPVMKVSPPKRSRDSTLSPAKPCSSIHCPICLETLEELKVHKIQLKSTMCGHILCSMCLDKMTPLGSGTNKTILCPICRTKLTKAKIHDIYL